MLAFQQYQLAFAAHIRDPKRNPRPEGIPAKRMGVYTHGVYLNVKEAASACFPVCQAVTGSHKWEQVSRLFFAQHAASTPIFREIPEEFLAFINSYDLTAVKLPGFFQQLAHYEWVELAVSAMPETHQPADITTNDLLRGTIRFAPHMLLTYDFPVHKISRSFKPEKQTPTFLLVFRQADDNVKFIELNPMTFQLLDQIKLGVSAKEALIQIAKSLQHPEPETVVTFGHSVLQDLAEQQAIIGHHTPT